MNRIADGVYEVGPGYVNAFVVDGDQGVTLIDTGLPNRDGEVASGLTEIGRRLVDVTAILITHSHYDHTGGAANLKEGSGADLVASREDAPAIEGDAPVPAPPMLRGPLAVITKLMPHGSPVTVDHRVSEGETTGLPSEFSVVNTPGHTPGHVSFLLERHGGVMFVGDAAAADRKGNVSKGFPNTFGGPQIVASIRHLGDFDFQIAVFGHAAPITSGAAEAFRAF